MYGATVGRMATLGVQAATNQAVCAFTPRNGNIDERFLFHSLQRKIPELLNRRIGGAQPNISQGIIRSLKIRLPPLGEQKRIAAILDKADATRRKRTQAIQLAAEFQRALFLYMFGDPVRNPQGWPQKSLRNCVEMANGSTPPKEVAEYWNGDIPWVSPKDMKFREIKGSIDHVSNLAVREQRVRIVPKDSVLIVIRGMILAHTVPIAITFVDCTINQDMKALQPHSELDPIFLAAVLRAMHGSLLSKVATSTHGTKKLDSEMLKEICLPLPPRSMQDRFRDMIVRTCNLQFLAEESKEFALTLQSSLVDKAFKGEL
jgi:type I restriction enzyme S subunit